MYIVFSLFMLPLLVPYTVESLPVAVGTSPYASPPQTADQGETGEFHSPGDNLVSIDSEHNDPTEESETYNNEEEFDIDSENVRDKVMNGEESEEEEDRMPAEGDADLQEGDVPERGDLGMGEREDMQDNGNQIESTKSEDDGTVANEDSIADGNNDGFLNKELSKDEQLLPADPQEGKTFEPLRTPEFNKYGTGFDEQDTDRNAGISNIDTVPNVDNQMGKDGSFTSEQTGGQGQNQITEGQVETNRTQIRPYSNTNESFAQGKGASPENNVFTAGRLSVDATNSNQKNSSVTLRKMGPLEQALSDKPQSSYEVDPQQDVPYNQQSDQNDQYKPHTEPSYKTSTTQGSNMATLQRDESNDVQGQDQPGSTLENQESEFNWNKFKSQEQDLQEGLEPDAQERDESQNNGANNQYPEDGYLDTNNMEGQNILQEKTDDDVSKNVNNYDDSSDPNASLRNNKIIDDNNEDDVLNQDIQQGQGQSQEMRDDDEGDDYYSDYDDDEEESYEDKINRIDTSPSNSSQSSTDTDWYDRDHGDDSIDDDSDSEEENADTMIDEQVQFERNHPNPFAGDDESPMYFPNSDPNIQEGVVNYKLVKNHTNINTPSSMVLFYTWIIIIILITISMVSAFRYRCKNWAMGGGRSYRNGNGSYRSGDENKKLLDNVYA